MWYLVVSFHNCNMVNSFNSIDSRVLISEHLSGRNNIHIMKMIFQVLLIIPNIEKAEMPTSIKEPKNFIPSHNKKV